MAKVQAKNIEQSSSYQFVSDTEKAAWNAGNTPPKLISGVTLSQTGWSLVDGLYQYTYSNSSITASSSVDVTPRNASINTVYNSNILPQVTVAAGAATIYACSCPQADIVVDIIITGVTE